MKNVFYAVYNKRGRAVAISNTINGAKEGALDISKYRWCDQTKSEVWGYLEKDGWKLLKSEIKPLTPKSKEER